MHVAKLASITSIFTAPTKKNASFSLIQHSKCSITPVSITSREVDWTKIRGSEFRTRLTRLTRNDVSRFFSSRFFKNLIKTLNKGMDIGSLPLLKWSDSGKPVSPSSIANQHHFWWLQHLPSLILRVYYTLISKVSITPLREYVGSWMGQIIENSNGKTTKPQRKMDSMTNRRMRVTKTS